MTTPLTPMQVMQQGIVNVMALSIFAQALGLIVAASGVEALEAAPSAVRVTDPAVEALRKAFGDEVVGKALADLPADVDAVTLARRVEHYVHEDLRKKYGEWAANIAIEGAPPGDMQTAITIAQTLSQKGITPASTPLAKAVAVAEGRRKGRAAAKPQRDTKTGIIYSSEYRAGLALAAEYKVPANQYAFWHIKRVEPSRLTPA